MPKIELYSKFGAGEAWTVHPENMSEQRLRVSESRGGVTTRMLPLLTRGFGIDEIWRITGFNLMQMHNVLEYLRQLVVLDRPTQEETNLTRQHTAHIREIISGRSFYTADQENSFNFASQLIKGGLIPTKDISSWQGLHELYMRHERRVPDLYAQRLRLEVVFTVHRWGDTDLLSSYRKLGEKFEPKWFDESLADDEDFVAVYSGRYNQGYNEDGIGFYNIYNGAKCYAAVMDGDIIDNSRLAAERQRSRELNAAHKT